MLNRLLRCNAGKRCNYIHACKECANNYQKRQFALHVKELDFTKLNSFYYVVVGSKRIDTLRTNLEEIKEFMKRFSARKNRKRGIFKFGEFFSRLEVSFKHGFGFYPHLNIMFFNVSLSELQEELYHLTDAHELKFKIYRKDADENTIKSMLWYILKYNQMEWKKGVAVQVACKGLQEIRYSTMFRYTDLNKFDDDILPLIDMSFMKIHPIRSGREVELNNKIKLERAKLNKKYRDKLSKLKRCACGCGVALDTKRKYYSHECMLRSRGKLHDK
jgi:hypothetical protein